MFPDSHSGGLPADSFENLKRLSIELYDRIVASPYPADRLMQTFFKERKQLGKRDRGFIAETVYGMLRNRRWLEWAFPDLDTMHRALAHLAIHQPDAALPLEPADDAQLRRADGACLERARLRALGPSLSISHGWEDLASFSGWENSGSEWADTRNETLYTHPVASDVALP